MLTAAPLIGVGSTAKTIPCTPITVAGLLEWQSKQPAPARNWIAVTNFQAKSGQCCLVPNGIGKLSQVLIGVDESSVLTALGALHQKLPAGNYRLEYSADVHWDEDAQHLAMLGYTLGGYKFRRYQSPSNQTSAPKNGKPGGAAKPPKFWLESARENLLHDEAEAVYFVRDLINTPPADMMPEDLAQVAEGLANQHAGKFKQTTGNALAKGYPMIHAVGRASVHPPRLIELTWGSAHHPLLVLVGKGICFDSGGLNLKPAGTMRHMKKDMGGAAHVLGLARLIMSQKLPVRLLVLVAAAENAVSGDGYRPGDVLKSRSGIQVEIDNTDAEGRLVLADALAYASELNPKGKPKFKPELMIDFATLTGAARIALGPAVGAMFTNNDEVATGLACASQACEDAIWRMPLYAPYQAMLASNIADCANASKSYLGGAIVAALFLQKFVRADIPWVHFDVMGWNVKSSPIGPVGGEAQGLRAAYSFVKQYLVERST